MSKELSLRPVRLEDADLLLNWRNDPDTRMASHNTAEIRREDHIKWLASSLDSETRTLLIVEEEGIPVGTVRADFANSVHTLSWTVAPNARGRGLGRRMVAQFAQRFPGPIRAEVKQGNDSSARIAEFAGMTFEKEEHGVLHYKCDRRRPKT